MAHICSMTVSHFSSTVHHALWTCGAVAQNSKVVAAGVPRRSKQFYMNEPLTKSEQQNLDT